MDGVFAAGYFLFSLVFSIITFVLWIRMALRYFHVSSLHPIGQMIHRLTDPVVLPLARALQLPNTRKHRYDWPCFALLAAVEVLKFLLVSWVFYTAIFPWFLLIVYPIAELIIQPLNLLFYAILIRVIMSWINPTWQNPLGDLIMTVTAPVLDATRRYVPYIAGFDFSPFVVLIAIKVITLFISASLPLHLL